MIRSEYESLVMGTYDQAALVPQLQTDLASAQQEVADLQAQAAVDAQVLADCQARVQALEADLAACRASQEPSPEPDPTPAPRPLGVDMFAGATFPTSGPEYDAALAIATRGPGPVDFGNHDSYSQSEALTAALFLPYGRGIGAGALRDVLAQVMNKPNANAAPSPLTAHRQLGGWMMTALVMKRVGAALPAGFEAWAADQLDAVQSGSGGSATATTVRGCAKTMPNNWGSYGRWSMACIGALLADRAVLDEVAGYHRRWCGELDVPNTFRATSEDNSGWLLPSSLPRDTAYSRQGVVNPATGDARAGANTADACRGSSGPPLVGKGIMYTVGALDGEVGCAAVLWANGYPDVFAWGDNAALRNAQSVNAAGWDAQGARDQGGGLVLQHVHGVTIPGVSPSMTVDRALPVPDWTAHPDSTWLRG